MLCYRLRTNTFGIYERGVRPVAISIPAGTVLNVPGGLVNNVGLVEVEWDGKCIHIFAVDLRDRGELVQAKSAAGGR